MDTIKHKDVDFFITLNVKNKCIFSAFCKIKVFISFAYWVSKHKCR